MTLNQLPKGANGLLHTDSCCELSGHKHSLLLPQQFIVSPCLFPPALKYFRKLKDKMFLHGDSIQLHWVNRWTLCKIKYLICWPTYSLRIFFFQCFFLYLPQAKIQHFGAPHRDFVQFYRPRTPECFSPSRKQWTCIQLFEARDAVRPYTITSANPLNKKQNTKAIN